MTAVIGFLLFSGAMALACSVIYASVAPQWRRIGALAMGRMEQPFAPLRTLATAERRIALRRWAATPARPATVRAAA